MGSATACRLMSRFPSASVSSSREAEAPNEEPLALPTEPDRPPPPPPPLWLLPSRVAYSGSTLACSGGAGRRGCCGRGCWCCCWSCTAVAGSAVTVLKEASCGGGGTWSRDSPGPPPKETARPFCRERQWEVAARRVLEDGCLHED